ncbi:SDR family NAD(P)-dependent oxidoreductase [Candidatus Dependentiae bacterium]
MNYNLFGRNLVNQIEYLLAFDKKRSVFEESKIFLKRFIFFCFLLINVTSCFFAKPDNKNAIIIGATSGMGRQTAKCIARDYNVGLVGRRVNLLKSLQKEIPTKSYIKQIDISKKKTAVKKLCELIKEMGSLDLIFISVSCANDIGDKIDFEANQKVIEVESIDVNKIPGAFWVAKTKKAAERIYDAIKNKKKKAYITKRWQLIAWLMDILPDCIYNSSWWKWRNCRSFYDEII